MSSHAAAPADPGGAARATLTAAQQRAAHLLQGLVAIPSVNPCLAEAEPPEHAGEQALAHHIAGLLRDMGLVVFLEEALPGRPNVVAHLPGKGPEPRPALLLQSHLDTVQVGHMTVPPFAGEVRDGRLYGRGACDAKGQLAAMLLALEELLAAPERPVADIWFAACVDEEFSFRGVTHLAGSGRRFDGAIVGEPTELDLVIAHKGVVRFSVITHGKAAHTSRPETGVNAIYLMNDVVAALRGPIAASLAERAHPLVGTAVATVSTIQGGSGVNTVPDRCEIRVDRRTLPDEDPLQAWQAMREQLLARLPVEIREHLELPPPFLADWGMEVRPDSAVVRALQAGLQAQRVQPRHRGVPFGTDASKLARAGVATVVFGPGSIAQAHAADEFIELAQVVAAGRALAAACHSFADALAKTRGTSTGGVSEA